ncbi:MAG: DUF1858 domain-containing protein [Planctomycetes bacterium]|nr:DUF1858 domain-containing protein [Planctomycetota bacterium]
MSMGHNRITRDMIVNDVTAKYPQTTEIFNKFGVDTCCGGVQSIEKTAIACSVNVNNLLNVLNDALPQETTQKVPISQKSASSNKAVKSGTGQNPITRDMIVNDVTAKYPQTTEIFNKYGVDTCCGGVQSIEKTAIACSVDVDNLLNVLNKSLPVEAAREESQTQNKTVKDDKKTPPEGAAAEGLREITGHTTVKEIIKNYPQTKGVFSKYGLLECGGEYGPEEAVYFFAKVHNVDGDNIIRELNDVIQGKEEAPEVPEEDAVTAFANIYEKFIKAAIVIALTTGCVYGAVMLFQMGLQHTLYGVSRVLIETHGHTQIFGWCGLFIMGVSYFVLPRFYATRLYSGKMANLSFVFMITGMLLVFVFRTILPVSDPLFFKILILAGCVLEVTAIVLFLIVAFKTILSAEKQDIEPYEGFIVSGYLWFLVQALLLSGITFYMIKSDMTVIPDALIYPLRHIQIMGFIMCVIFGVLSRTLPVFLGLRAPNPKLHVLIMLAFNFSVLLRAFSEPLKAYFLDVNMPIYYTFNTVYFTSGCLQFLSIMLFFYNLNLLTKPEVDYSGMEIEKGYEKFVLAGIIWLVVAEIAMLIFTFYETATGTPVSHAIMGAYRHAVTVGFITMLIFGYASRIIPISQGIKLYSYTSLLITFVLINIGSILRVIFQPLAVHTGSTHFYWIMGVSGFIESLAILLFGINIWKTLNAGKRGPDEDEVQEKITTVTASTNVHQVITQYPQTIDIFVKRGFVQLKNPVLRRTLARAVNITQAVKIKPTDIDQLLRELNEAIQVKRK